MHRSGPKNIFSDVYIIPLTVVLVHSTAYVQAHILNLLPVISLPAPWVWEREKGCVCVCVWERVSVKEGVYVFTCVFIYLFITYKKCIYEYVWKELQKAREIFWYDQIHDAQLYGTYQIAYKYSHHWAEVHFQGNSEKGPLVGFLQLSLKFLCSLLLQVKI